MPITIEQLDNDGKENDVTILLGKNLLLKLVPGDSVFFKEKALQDLIKISDLLPSDIFTKIMKEKELSEDISDKLSSGIKTQEDLASLRATDETFDQLIKKTLEKTKQEVADRNDKIRDIERETRLFLAKNFPLYFCRDCVSYLANSSDSLPDSCKFCGRQTEEDQQTFTRFLDARVISYLNGFWLEDYIAKILKSIGWKTWCHGSVMGSSGTYHPIDILAIDPNGRTLVAECKSGAFGTKDIFSFSAQYFDIKSPYGFFFALRERPDSRGKEFMERTPGLCLLDNLEGLPDAEIAERVENSIKA
ncbi:MAG: hypothetical protein ABH831_01875 [Candidatus Nealsonbacteria bacterium]